MTHKKHKMNEREGEKGERERCFVFTPWHFVMIDWRVSQISVSSLLDLFWIFHILGWMSRQQLAPYRNLKPSDGCLSRPVRIYGGTSNTVKACRLGILLHLNYNDVQDLMLSFFASASENAPSSNYYADDAISSLYARFTYYLGKKIV